MKYEEYIIARDNAEKDANLVFRDPDFFNRENSILLASKMPTRVLEAVVDNTLELPKNSWWIPEWIEVCENELFERLFLKNDKCL